MNPQHVHAASPPALDSILGQQIACAQTLLDCLQREREALLGHSIAQLENVSAEKWTAASTLQSLAATLERFHGGIAGVQRLITQAGSAPALKESWQELLRLAGLCQQGNLSNGALLQERQAQLRRTMTALRDSSGGETYGRAGLSLSAPAPRAFGRV